VDDLLDVSRIRRGKIDLRREAVPLEFAVIAAAEANRALIETKQQDLVIDLAPVFLLADETRLMQIVSNLLNNAAKYTQEGGRIEIRAKQSGDVAVLTVKDSGPGISKELLSRVFDLFAQGERSLDRSQGGLGIGLTIVKSLVELHDGQIAVKSEPGAGTEFTVTLPISKTPPAPRKIVTDGKPQAAGPRARKKVLVVDDHADGTEALTLLLRALGHETRSSINGPSALEVAKSFVPDVVLLDIGLPGMDGYEVARRIRRLLKEKSPLLVAMTGYGQEKDKKQAYAAGFDLHLTKPVSGEAVEALFERS
jgi:CheY-like chemotaxis protein/anti-sigma regulatory factor (Ser/Thr protein kinase)